MGQRRATYKVTEKSNQYNDARVIYSLRRLFNWDKAVLKVRRSSDNAVKWVFFNGIDINLSSLIGDDRNTHGATTLGSWAGSDSVYVEEWISQNNLNTIDTDDIISQTTTSLQPILISIGSLREKNGKTALYFSTSYLFRIGGALSTINNGSTYTVVAVASSEELAGPHAYLGTVSATFGYRVGFYIDRTAGARIIEFITSSGTYVNKYSAQINDSNQRLLTNIIKNKDVDSYYNGTLTDSLTFVNNYTNTAFLVGTERTNNARLVGYLQELIVFPSDKVDELSNLHDDINSYYSIF